MKIGNDVNTGECMEYAQKLCYAQTSAERNAARAELRQAIDACVAAERERCAKLCDAKFAQHAADGFPREASTARALAAAIRAA